MTAQEKLKELLALIKVDEIMDYLSEDSPEELESCLNVFKEFAKFHVEAALKATSEEKLINIKSWSNNYNTSEYEYFDDSGDKYTITVSKNSILNAYPLDLIK